MKLHMKLHMKLKDIDEQNEQKLSDPHLCDYSRISGSTENWNTGKQQEFMERREYDFGSALGREAA